MAKSPESRAAGGAKGNDVQTRKAGEGSTSKAAGRGGRRRDRSYSPESRSSRSRSRSLSRSSRSYSRSSSYSSRSRSYSSYSASSRSDSLSSRSSVSRSRSPRNRRRATRPANDTAKPDTDARSKPVADADRRKRSDANVAPVEQKPQDPSEMTKVTVSPVTRNITPEHLVEILSLFAKVKTASVPADPRTGRPRGVGYVTFETHDDAVKAAEAMDGGQLDGMTVRVVLVKDSKEEEDLQEFRRKIDRKNTANGRRDPVSDYYGGRDRDRDRDQPFRRDDRGGAPFRGSGRSGGGDRERDRDGAWGDRDRDRDRERDRRDRDWDDRRGGGRRSPSPFRRRNSGPRGPPPRGGRDLSRSRSPPPRRGGMAKGRSPSPPPRRR
ncbi:RNA-binding protein with serine-rich domain 1 [Phlyctochytrium bullatum]|nr:RNA-binding protein with serine-rich domain 1 [Phlyctochytrium bullatum]